MNYWLFKSEPSTYGIDHLVRDKTSDWEGVRNYQARNFMKAMKVGDLGFFYHSSCAEPGIVGIVEVVTEAEPDWSALDPKSHYFDPKSTRENPRWYCVRVGLVEHFSQMISLQQLRGIDALSHMRILQKGNRLSITPVDEVEWKVITTLSKPA